ncbi:AAA family ATPase [Shimia ponticola]|uniref:AAA family ATPase n=1 Tax=Shimia ponticola TaxID=2582893 RepID=UPI0011BE4F27|nr:AAA family ATPase [Shimia ponticola]
MRIVRRDIENPPPSLGSSGLQRLRSEFLEFYALQDKERAQTTPPTGPLGKEHYEDVMPPLIDLFHGKCAFCEQANLPLEPYQFRPPAFAQTMRDGDEMVWLNFSWLAHAWENLYPICEDCLPEDRSFFPTDPPEITPPSFDDVRDYVDRGTGVWGAPFAETPILLDPCSEDASVFENLRVDLSGKLEGLTETGTLTIDHFRLNRDRLVSRREKALQSYLEDADPETGSLRQVTAEIEFAGILTQFRLQNTSGSELMREILRPQTKEPEPRRYKGPRVPHFDLHSVDVTNYRAIENLHLELPPRPKDRDLARALLILGENATGKSSLLEAIAQTLVNSRARGLLDEKASSILLNPKYMGCDEPTRDRAEVSLTLKDRNDDTRVVGLSVTLGGGKRARGDRFDDYPIYAYGAYRHYRNSLRTWRADRGVRNLFHSDDLLSNPKKWLLQLEEATFDMVIAALRDIIGGGFNTIDREDGDCLVVIREPAPTNPDGTPIPGAMGDIISRAPLDTLSSGFRTILALSCDMMRWHMERDDFTSLRDARGLCMIDEVEAHLHPRWKVSVMAGLRRAFPAMTFIVTTHDPLCIRGMQDGEVMVLQRQKRDTAQSGLPVYVDMLTKLPDVTKLTIEQLLTSDFFDLFDTTDEETSINIAEVASILALYPAGQQPTNPRHRQVIESFRAEISDALPVGTTAASRIVQDAVAQYLIQRRDKAPEIQTKMRQSTINDIIAALEATDAQG